MAKGDHGWFQRITGAEAEQILGCKLDKRRQYFKHADNIPVEHKDNGFLFWGSKVFTYGEWTTACSGCSDDREYVVSEKGGGCRECGYTGKRRDGMHTPFDPNFDPNNP